MRNIGRSDIGDCYFGWWKGNRRNRRLRFRNCRSKFRCFWFRDDGTFLWYRFGDTMFCVSDFQCGNIALRIENITTRRGKDIFLRNRIYILRNRVNRRSVRNCRLCRLNFLHRFVRFRGCLHHFLRFNTHGRNDRFVGWRLGWCFLSCRKVRSAYKGGDTEFKGGARGSVDSTYRHMKVEGCGGRKEKGVLVLDLWDDFRLSET